MGRLLSCVLDEPGFEERWERALVVATCARDELDARQAIRRAAKAGAAGIVVRLPLRIPRSLRSEAIERQMVVFGLPAEDSWSTFLTAMAAASGQWDARTPVDFSAPSEGLAGLADAIASEVGAPVSIEDRNSVVLAHSAGQHGADQARLDSILKRKTPDELVRSYRDAGLFRRVHHSREPVFVPGAPELQPRMVISVQVGTEILGTVWAVVKKPFTSVEMRAFRTGADRVAVELLRQRADLEASRVVASRRWTALLDGDHGVVTSADESDKDLAVVIWACDPITATGLQERQGSYKSANSLAFRALVDALRFDPACSHPDAGVVAVGSIVYVLQPVTLGPDGQSARATAAAADAARRFLAGRGSSLCHRIAISRVAHGAENIPDARRDADRALRVLRAHQESGAVGSIEDLATDALFMELRDVAAAARYQHSAGVQRLVAYDRAKGTELVRTLRSWLSHLGEVAPAAADMHVHPNTFRYRLRRALAISGIEQETSTHTLSLMLELKLVELQEM